MPIARARATAYTSGARQQAEAEQAAQVQELRLELARARSQIEQLQEECRRARCELHEEGVERALQLHEWAWTVYEWT